jgi:hypothetical protein
VRFSWLDPACLGGRDRPANARPRLKWTRSSGSKATAAHNPIRYRQVYSVIHP